MRKKDAKKFKVFSIVMIVTLVISLIFLGIYVKGGFLEKVFDNI